MSDDGDPRAPHSRDAHADEAGATKRRAPHASHASGPQRLTQAIEKILSEGGAATLATLVEGPRSVGAKMLVQSLGASVGTLGDDELDQVTVVRAVSFRLSRAEASTLKVEDFAPHLAEWRGARVLFERVEPEPHVVVCGAGHVGASLARLARSLSYRVTLIDDRADFVTRERFPDEGVALVVAREGWARAVRDAVGTGRGVSVAVVTRGHNEDEECLRAVIEAQPDYVGMIGSRRRTNIVLTRLREAGVTEELLREVRAPIGLDIGAVSPEEVALSILAEIVAERRGGGTRTPLSAWRRA